MFAVLRVHHPDLSSQETTVSGNPLSGLELHSSLIFSKGILTFKMCLQMTALSCRGFYTRTALYWCTEITLCLAHGRDTLC